HTFSVYSGISPSLSCFFFFSSRRRHTRFSRDWSSDVCSSDLRPRSCFPPLAAHPERAGGAPFLSRTLVSLRILRATTSRRPVPESNPNPRRYQRSRWGGHEWSGMPSAAAGHLRQKRQRSFLPGPFLAVEDRL